MRFSRWTQIHSLIIKKAKKYTKCNKNTDQILATVNSLDNDRIKLASKKLLKSLSLSKYIECIKSQDSSLNKRKSNQHMPKLRIIKKLNSNV